MMTNYDALKMKTFVLNIQCVCEGCKRKIKLLLQKVDGVYTVAIDSKGGRVKVTGNFDPRNITRKLEKSVSCPEIEAQKSSHSFKSAAQSERSQSGNSKAGGSGSHKSQNSVKSGGEAKSQSHKGSKASTFASMENISVKNPELADLESMRCDKSRARETEGGKSEGGKSRGAKSGGGKSGGKGGLFGFIKYFGFGKNGGEKGSTSRSKKIPSARGSSRGESKKSSKKSQMRHHSGEQAREVDDISLLREPSVGRSSIGGSKWGSTSHHSRDIARDRDDISLLRAPSASRSSRGGSKRGAASHHSGEMRSQMGDPRNQRDLPMEAMLNRQRGAHDDAPHRPISPPGVPPEPYVHLFSDDNVNACRIT